MLAPPQKRVVRAGRGRGTQSDVGVDRPASYHEWRQFAAALGGLTPNNQPDPPVEIPAAPADMTFVSLV